MQKQTPCGFEANLLSKNAHQNGEDVFVVFSTEGAALSIFSEQGMEKMASGSMDGTGCGSYTLDFEVEMEIIIIFP